MPLRHGATYAPHSLNPCGLRPVPSRRAASISRPRDGLPRDPKTWVIDDQFLIGESFMAAPAFAGEPSRDVYLQEGDWFDYLAGKRYTGKRQIRLEVPLDQIPLFVKSATLLPLAESTLHADDPASWRLTVHVLRREDHFRRGLRRRCQLGSRTYPSAIALGPGPQDRRDDTLLSRQI